MEKIAILIIAHKNFNQVEILINQFDPKYYDIYIHIDKKVTEEIGFINKNVYLINNNKVDIKWGEYSMVEAMLLLLSEAKRKKYSFYWFVSGQDLLLMNSERIYFDILKTNKNYINFMDKKTSSKYQYRSVIKYKSAYSSRNLFRKITRTIKFRLVNLYCNMKKTNFVYGSQWSILKYDFIEYLFKEEVINKYDNFFRNKLIPDESYFQTLLIESPFNKEIVNNSLYVDWSNGGNNPKILTTLDKEKLFNSNKYIARKFDITINEEIILKIKEKTK